mmetsp:Transcript_22127/g.69395  ORF Transcript_22127/g.69395 Transcript_22127/m.69395 type:complete len:337 (-) Transcript_22127:107-1117(-)
MLWRRQSLIRSLGGSLSLLCSRLRPGTRLASASLRPRGVSALPRAPSGELAFSSSGSSPPRRCCLELPAVEWFLRLVHHRLQVDRLLAAELAPSDLQEPSESARLRLLGLRRLKELTTQRLEPAARDEFSAKLPCWGGPELGESVSVLGLPCTDGSAEGVYMSRRLRLLRLPRLEELPRRRRLAARGAPSLEPLPWAPARTEEAEPALGFGCINGPARGEGMSVLRLLGNEGGEPVGVLSASSRLGEGADLAGTTGASSPGTSAASACLGRNHPCWPPPPERAPPVVGGSGESGTILVLDPGVDDARFVLLLNTPLLLPPRSSSCSPPSSCRTPGR